MIDLSNLKIESVIRFVARNSSGKGIIDGFDGPNSVCVKLLEDYLTYKKGFRIFVWRSEIVEVLPKDSDSITITKAEYKRLAADSLFLDALRAAGVDNWDGYSTAQEFL